MRVTDEYGAWEVYDNVRLLIEPSQKWIDEHKADPIAPEPTEVDYIVELDYRLSILELGL